MPNSHPFVTTVNALLEKLDCGSSIKTGIDLANEILSLLGAVDKKSPEEVFESSIELPNAERYDSWFQPHPIFKSDRACFELTDANLFQAKFYWLKKHSRQIIAGGVHFTPNFEDEDFTHNDRYKVGIDFFLSPNGKSLQVVLSNRGNLRIVELNKRLNSTQVDIFSKWIGAENLSTQNALHNTLWESFKLKSVNQKFYDGVANSFNELFQHLKSIDKEDEEAKLFASRLLGRLLFCWFLRKKGIIDETVGYFNAKGHSSTDYYRSSLEKLFYLTLNTPLDERDELQRQHQRQLFADLIEEQQPSLFKTDQRTPYLNGGLFEPHENDWFRDDSLTFPEGFFVNLFEHFEQFNFTTDESSPEYELIAIDPEMLGRVFESLLATQIDETGKKATKAKGTFYTPREIVSYMCKESLRIYLYEAAGNKDDIKSSIDSLLDISDSEWAKAKSNTLRDKIKDYRVQIIDALDNVTILDPACGSGAFPMGMLQLCIKAYERLESRFDPYKTKLQIIQNNIFGVDIEPMAVEIARLRAWLSLIVDEEDGRSVEPLPNLDFKFVCANSLMPLESDNQASFLGDNGLHETLKDLRNKYFNARKPDSKKKLQNEYRKLITQKSLFDDLRTRQLQSFNPFKNLHPSDFFNADQMFGISDGFSIVIGNPPYGAKIPVSDKKKYQSFYQSAKTITGKQKGSVDTYALFIDLGLYHAIQKKGVLCYIVPLAFTSSESMSALHGMMLKDCGLIQVSTYSNRPKKIFDNADQRVSIVLANKNGESATKLLTTGVLKRYSTTSVRDIVDNLSFVNSIDFIRRGRLPKIGSDIEYGILETLFQNKTVLSDFITKQKTDNVVYYRTAGGRYYHIIANYKTGSTQEKALYLNNQLSSGVIGAILSSNLYFWLSQAYTDNLHLKEYELTMLPIPEIAESAKAELETVYKQYTTDLEKNAVVKSGNYNTISEFKEYRARLSKPIIDKIDRILQKAYGLSDEQTNYLINFELKFRTDDE